MAISKVKTGFTKYTDNNLELKGNYIASKMNGNNNFANPTPTVATVQGATDEFSVSIVAAQDGTKENTANKNAMRAALILVLNNLAVFIQANGGGDETINLSSGYDVTKKHARVGLLAKPENFAVNAGPNSGSVKLSTNTVPKKAFYEFEYMVAGADENGVDGWFTQTSTKRSCIISGLMAGVQYSFRVAGAGADPGRVYSDIITKFVS